MGVQLGIKMKRCKNITCWTDYPFKELGDEPYKPAPIRHVRVIGYDGNKYASIIVEGIESSVKWGYLYRNAGRLGCVKTISRRKLERMIPVVYNDVINNKEKQNE